ncbi:MAG: putative phosphothreonine lyase domain-containing protein [Candidatus Hodarchaeales archaeon]|jgi:uncharacterized protein (DUF433 family)
MREIFKGITIDPDVCHGKPCVEGTHIFISLILDSLASGSTFEEILQEFPSIFKNDIINVIEYSKKLIEKELEQNRQELNEKSENKKEYQVFFPQDYLDKPPSKVTDIYWIYSHRKEGTYPKSTPRSGKWMIFASVDKIDNIWYKIKKATEDGNLGELSKVSTMKISKLAEDPNKKVICVYTYDWKDEKDVFSIRENLRKLGFSQKIPYKTNEDTLKGRYIWKGDTEIYKYQM